MVEEQEASRSTLKDASRPGTSEEATSPACSCCTWWKFAVVVVLAGAVGGVMIFRNGRDASSTRGPVPVAQPEARAATMPGQEPGEAQEAPAADNPLDRALQSGRPVLADFGRGKCIPCKMMKPILDDLKDEYAGRAEILIIDVDEYSAVTQRCRIRAIPTQIFYDAQGKEVFRHEGFMPREDIVAKLAEMGVGQDHSSPAI